MKTIKMDKSLLINGDCLEVMEKLIEQGIKVDAIITDPPYNIARKNNFTTMGRSGIDFGEWDKNADILSWIEKAKYILNKDACVYVFNAWKNLGDIARTLEDNNIEVKDMTRFVKTNPMPRNRDRRYITDYECAIWAVNKGAKWVFNRLSETYERPEFRCAIEKGFHPTQKPISLMEHILKIHTNEGGLC